MTADYPKNDISLNDALALLLGHGLWFFRAERVDLLEHLERTLADCATEFKEATKSNHDDATISKYKQAAELASQELDRAGVLYTRLCGEVAKIRQGKPSEIVLVEEDPEKKGYDLVLISRQSLYDWADQAEIVVGSAHPPPTRTHTTPLLELLDELVLEFWEDYDSEQPPKNDAIEAYIIEKYGSFKSKGGSPKSKCKIPGASDKVISALMTVMRPLEMR